MEISWDDIAHTRTPGWITVDGMRFRVEQMHIDMWETDPGGAWTLKEFRCLGEASQWVLGHFRPSAYSRANELGS
jgi:hypothetical protein